MNKFNLVVDSEVRIVHPEARKINFAKNSKEEKIHKAIYADRRIIKTMKLWSIESVIASMKRSNIKYGVLSGLHWTKLVNLKKNNDYIRQCIQTYPNRFKR